MKKSLKGQIVGGKDNYGIGNLTLGGVVRKWLHNMVFSMTNLATKKDEIFLDNYAGGKKEDVRPCLFSPGGILGKHTHKEKFFVSHQQVDMAGGKRIKVYDSTDCPLSTGGVGAHLTTDDIVICQDVSLEIGKNKTKWWRF